MFRYINVNPKNKKCGDCVVRAIALALNQSWEKTIRELTELGIKIGYVFNDKNTYTKYLLLKGFKECKEPRTIDNKKMTINQRLKNNDTRNCSIVVNAGSYHLSCIINNEVCDIWDCSLKTMHKYWVLIK